MPLVCDYNYMGAFSALVRFDVKPLRYAVNDDISEFLRKLIIAGQGYRFLPREIRLPTSLEA